MSIMFFEEDSFSPTAGRLPFVEDFVEANKPPYKPCIITSVARTKKRSGYMVNTEYFSIFLFNESQVLNQLLEALNHWAASSHGSLLLAEPMEKDPYYRIGADADEVVQWVLTKGKYSWQRSIGSGLTQPATPNPFLPQTQTATRTRHKSAQTPATNSTSES